MTAEKLDKFYTRAECAHWCYSVATQIIADKLNVDVGELFYVEPSAGDGAFFKCLPDANSVAIDIESSGEQDWLWRYDFLSESCLEFLTSLIRDNAKAVMIGNPPFGKRGNKAVQFFWQGAKLCDTIAMIFPASFNNYSIQRQLPAGWKLIYNFQLPLNDCFELPCGKPYSVNTAFQIWTKLPTSAKDLRKTAAPTTHDDFILYQYNNTKKALKVFDNDFDFAVPCQGYQDYNKKALNENECDRRKQYILIKAHTPQALTRLYGIDYESLAARNATKTPGFRKHDVVEAYNKAQ